MGRETVSDLQIGLRIFQFAVFLGFLFANVYFEWGIEGAAAAVMGGMLAYYSTKIILAFRGELPRSDRRSSFGLAPAREPADALQSAPLLSDDRDRYPSIRL